MVANAQLQMASNTSMSNEDLKYAVKSATQQAYKVTIQDSKLYLLIINIVKLSFVFLI